LSEWDTVRGGGLHTAGVMLCKYEYYRTWYEKQTTKTRGKSDINPLNAELNPIGHLRALLGAHHILQVKRIRVKFLCVCLKVQKMFPKKIPVVTRFSACPDRPWGPPSLLYNGYRVFPGGKVGRGVELTTHPM